MAVRAETQITLTRVDDGSPGSTGPQGPQGWGIVATVERNAFTESQWTTYGTIGHVEGWSGTSSIRNGCRIGDLFLVKGTATDTGRSHELTYRSDTSSGDLHGECINHTYADRGATGATGPEGPQGPQGPEGVVYGTSSTAAATAAKTATVDNYELDSKQYFAVKFTNENTASNPTLSVNGGTAKAIYTNGVNAAYWEAGATVNFYYDGTYYQVASAPVYASTVTVGNPNGDNVFIGNSAVQIKNSSTVRAEYGGDYAKLATDKARIKYIEGPGVEGVQSHRVVISKSTNDSGVRNDAVLTSLDLANFDQNTTPMSFVDASSMTSGSDKGADCGLYVYDGKGNLAGFLYLGGGDQSCTALGKGLTIEAKGFWISDTNTGGAKLIGSSGNIEVLRGSSGNFIIDGDPVKDWVTSKGKTGSWYYQKWASGKIEAWSDAISSGTLTMSQSYRLYRTSNTEFTIANGIFDSTPTNAYVTIPYSSNAAIVNALVTCYSATKLRCQIWKDSNNSSTQQAAVNLKFYVVYFPSTY